MYIPLLCAATGSLCVTYILLCWNEYILIAKSGSCIDVIRTSNIFSINHDRLLMWALNRTLSLRSTIHLKCIVHKSLFKHISNNKFGCRITSIYLHGNGYSEPYLDISKWALINQVFAILLPVIICIILAMCQFSHPSFVKCLGINKLYY